MKIEKYGAIVPTAMFFYLLISGYNIVNPLPLTYDPALHGEISAYILPKNFIPANWQPLSDVAYTYPPLFHWLAFLISLTGVEAYRVVISMGLFLYALFPVTFYLYGLSFGKKEAIWFSFFGAVQASLIEVFAAGEYPQLLSMNLLLIVLFFLNKRSYGNAAIFSGLVLLSHTFSTVYMAALLMVHYLIHMKRIKMQDVMKFVFAAFLVSFVWVTKYLEIANSALKGSWENTIWYYQSGFVGLDKISSMFFSVMPGSRMGFVLLLLSLAGSFYLYRRKNYFPLAIFLFTIAFTIFHIPGTQYKFPDMLAIAAPPLAAIGLIRLLEKRSIGKLAVLSVLLLIVLVNPYMNANNLRNCCVSTDIPNVDQANLAKWLRVYDSSNSVLLADGNYEVWFSLIANKYPMNPRVSELEVFTDNYRLRLSDRLDVLEGIKQGMLAETILDKWGVVYLVTGERLNSTHLELVREENSTKLYKYYA
ncbi:MAG: hypothetical protein HYT71_01560 [Candidatus Aenigmarchaeota archaeon]|nr:hypothetical protein [Candidatus Aenigmarchaeota archaeon]